MSNTKNGNGAPNPLAPETEPSPRQCLRRFSKHSLQRPGFATGIFFWGCFSTALQATNTEDFCIGCHG